MIVTSPRLVGSDAPRGFTWHTGIEGSHIPQQQIDQHAWCQHDRFMADDLARIRDWLGPTTVRYSLPWSRLCTSPTDIDWRPADQVLAEFDRLDLTPQINLMHFGTPDWLEDGVAHVDFPQRLADYCAAFAHRYRGRVPWYTPMTEPLITALFCADVGVWYPYRQGFEAYVPVLMNVARAVSLASQAVRAADPEARLLHVESSERHHAGSADRDVTEMAAFRNLRRFLSYDLILGRVTPQHPLWSWLSMHGMRETDARWLVEHPAPLDVMGLNYHPQSEKIVFRRRGAIAQRTRAWTGPVEWGAVGRRAHFAPLGRDYYARYGYPIALTETSFCGGIDQRRPQVRWLQEIADDCATLRAEGVPLVAATWYGAYDHLDWHDAMCRPVGNIHPVGLWQLRREGDGTLSRHPTELLEAFARLSQTAEMSATG
jgi:beta-glucosidase/6-phospho-beta-glucosidase/beta-galactosidase